MKQWIQAVFILLLASVPVFGNSTQVGGSMEITSSPEHASVFVDHVYKGTTPTIISNLALGSHLLRVNLNTDYLPYLKNVEVKSKQRVERHIQLEKTASAWFADGLRARDSGKKEAAIRYFRNAADGKPKMIVNAYFELGLLYLENGQLDESIKALQRYAFYRSDSSAVYMYLGKAYEEQGELDKALTSYKLAVLHVPALKDSLRILPEVTWTSIARMKKEVDLNAQHMSTRIRLAYAYEQKGLFPKAIDLLQPVLQQYHHLIMLEQTAWENHAVSQKHGQSIKPVASPDNR